MGLLSLACNRTERRAPPGTLRLGFFPNITHAQALVGQSDGTYARALGEGKLEYRQFTAGPAAMEALISGSIDATYVGTGPAITAYLKAGGTLRVLSGSASGGAVLVTRERWTPAELRGKRLATPQLGNTQDVALRHWLGSHGLRVSTEPTGDVRIFPLANADTLSLFQRGQLDGAWVPEPWGARLIASGGVLLVDERSLWSEGQFPTTLLVTTTEVMAKKPRELAALLEAHRELTHRWARSPHAFAAAANQAFGRLTGKPLPDALRDEAFSRLEPTLDPMPEALRRAAEHARELGFVPSAEVEGMVPGEAPGRARRTHGKDGRPPVRPDAP